LKTKVEMYEKSKFGTYKWHVWIIDDC
jgi:hypothetical protein